MSEKQPPVLSKDELETIRDDIRNAVENHVLNEGDGSSRYFDGFEISDERKDAAIAKTLGALNDLREASPMLNTFFEDAVVSTRFPGYENFRPQAISFGFAEGFHVSINPMRIERWSVPQIRAAAYQVFMQVVNGGLTERGDRDHTNWSHALNIVMIAALRPLIDTLGGPGFLEMPEPNLGDEQYDGLTIEEVYNRLSAIYDAEGEPDETPEEAAKHQQRLEAAMDLAQAKIDSIRFGLKPVSAQPAKDFGNLSTKGVILYAEFLNRLDQ